VDEVQKLALADKEREIKGKLLRFWIVTAPNQSQALVQYKLQ
jgi:hypothetical protein